MDGFSGNERFPKLVSVRPAIQDGDKLSLVTGDGLLSSSSIRPAERALLDCVAPNEDDSVLVPDANYGATGLSLARAAPEGLTVLYETSARAADCCRTNADRNDLSNVETVLSANIPTSGTTVDLAVHAPKPYDPVVVVEQRIANALTRVSPGGSYYIAGPDDGDINRYAQILSALTGSAEEIDRDGDVAVYRAERPHDYQCDSVIEPTEFRATVSGYTCRFLTQPGLFSADQLDDGTEALLRTAAVADGDRVLDCCCGYGAVGAFVGARTNCRLWATDDNALATMFAERNYDRNGVDPEAVYTSDCFTDLPELTFDTILVNPPTHAGKGVTTRLFEDIHGALSHDGRLWVVANQIMEYDRVLATDFNFDVVDTTGIDRYEVIEARP